MTTNTASKQVSKWYQDWQSSDHAVLFDSRSRLSDRGLVRCYESFNDVLLLVKALRRSPQARVLEVGCATGEFHRYLRIRAPQARYYGMDISGTAIAKARRKYPQGSFFQNQPESKLAESLRAMGLPSSVEILYSKDVVHHQTDPYAFFGQLIDAATEAVIVRLRTRDQGETVTDPEISCQYHYQGWMPYLVLNMDEVIQFLQERAPESELVVCRNYQVLGGRENRYLPKECYLPETETAETAVSLLRRAGRPGRVVFQDGPDGFVPAGFCSGVKGKIKQRVQG